MQLPLAVFLFLLLSLLHSNIKVESIDSYGIQNDLREFNLTCKEKCESYILDSLRDKDCECGARCSQLGTCCLDSLYINVEQPTFKPACRKVQNGEHYFIVDRCSSDDSVWASLCNGDEHDLQHADDNIQKIVPVTSLYTSITYKNIYCLRCHETTNDFVYWNVKVESDLPQKTASEIKSKLAEYEYFYFAYNKELNTWMAYYDEKYGYFSVIITVTVPNEIERVSHRCIANLISDCSDKWSDDEVKEKCQSYMAMKEVEITYYTVKNYKNIHCALCNFEKLSDIRCRSGGGIFFSKVAFSFTYLLDINRSDGELVGKIQRCSEDNIWDPYTKQCRKLSCALPGYTVKSGKCVKE